jgi:hypothetical protein
VNPLNLSPAAQLFWAGVIRHVLSGLGAFAVAHGYATKAGSDAYLEELIGAVLMAASYAWSNRTTYWQEVRKLIGRAMPAGTTAVAVTAKVDELHEANALPSVFTPPDVTPSLAKPTGK